MAVEKITPDDPVSRSADLVAQNLARLRELFPEAFTEGKVDFEVLKQLLGGAVDEREEKYGLNWHGKRRARQLALTPSTGTLRPCPEDSVDWDTTQNLMIEGDNLEVLKLLQKSYAGKVKLIHIDPPYNTGKDFVYPDDYQDNIQNYLELTGQTELGRKLSSNTEANGRFHTDWLNMIYPRLKLAQALLSEDGVIFITIGDKELSRLLQVCDEIFGEENFVGTFVWEKRTNRENRKVVSSRHDYIVCYCRDASAASEVLNKLPMNDEALARYKNPDNDPRGPWKSDPATAQAGHGTKGQFYVLTAPNGTRHELPSGRCWVYTEEVMNEAIRDGRIWFGQDGCGVPRIKTYLYAKDRGLTPESIWFAADASTNERAKNSLKELFDGQAVFDTPKPVELVQLMLQVGASGGIVMDFFAGSGTTGHAVMLQNAQDGGNRRFILVQLPEPLDPDDKDQRIAAQFCDSRGVPRNIAELTKERLRRAARKIRSDNPNYAGDLGFRAFKLDSTNFREWDPHPTNLGQALLDHLAHIKTGRTETDILYELLLKHGLDLCVPIEQRTIAGKSVYSIGAGTVMVCLSETISRAEVEPLAHGIVEWHQALAPAGDTTCIFRDSAFDDVSKTNLAAILEQAGISKVRSL